MKLTKAHYVIESGIDIKLLRNLERIGRVCYKSEEKITEESAKAFIAMLIQRGHESVIEHAIITVRFICDRGVSHELVRHRLASFSQESTRYCNYKGGVEFIIPEWVAIAPGNYEGKDYYKTISEDTANLIWFCSMLNAENDYKALLEKGWIPQQARSVLPNSTKTEIVISANLREWRTIFKQRTSNAAHPQMRELMCPLLDDLKTQIPVVFDDITY